MRRLTLLICAALTWLAAHPASAECFGQNLFDQMTEAETASLRARAEAEPFARGNFWTATRDGQTITLVGTYHFGDPRHDATLAGVAPLIETATAVLVEAGPEEEQALLDRMTQDPSVMILTDETLPELLPPEDWARLSDAMALRGIPGFMAAKFRPWYVSMLLATPACAMSAALERDGLDALIIDQAQAAGVPVAALEPFDTVFRIFDSIPLEDQLKMITQTLAMDDRAEDFSVTLADSYFAGDSRLIWELMRHETLRLPGTTEAEVDAEMAQMEEAMMNSRNRAWIPVLESAAEKGPVVAAFGALHLAGEEGVANLLAARGWTLTPLDLRSE